MHNADGGRVRCAAFQIDAKGARNLFRISPIFTEGDRIRSDLPDPRGLKLALRYLATRIGTQFND